MSKEKISLPHTCPNCKTTTANTDQEVETLFGRRKMNRDSNEIRIQSWCRECRKISNKK